MRTKTRYACAIVAASLIGMAQAQEPTASMNAARVLSNALADVMEETMPSVVVIRTEAIRYHLAQDWFRGQVYRIPERLAGQGSGVILSEDGYIMTSAHVIQQAQNIEVVLDDGSIFEAEIIGSDTHTDLAVLKIREPGDAQFRPMTFADSDTLRVGEVVIAIGSPFSLSGSVTMGIVSQKGRRIGLLPYEDFIQTDASINPGNSGGPLVNVEGRMVGLNAGIQTPNRAVQANVGIGFAVPVNLARRVAEAIIEKGRFDRPWIGIAPRDLTPAQQREQTGGRGGIAVVEVFEGTPAHAAGVRAGDIILRVGDTAITGTGDLQNYLMRQPADAEFAVHLLRNGRERAVRMRTEPLPSLRQMGR